jgi:hypothetical protein
LPADLSKLDRLASLGEPRTTTPGQQLRRRAWRPAHPCCPAALCCLALPASCAAPQLAGADRGAWPPTPSPPPRLQCCRA